MKYYEECDEKYLDRLNELRKTSLPKFLKTYFVSNSDLIPSTRYGYAIDLKEFFEWVKSTLPQYNDVPVTELPITCLEEISVDMATEYIKDVLGIKRNNSRDIQKRKLASLRSMYKYMLVTGKLQSNPTEDIVLKDNTDHEIIYLEPNEVAILLDCIEFEFYEDILNSENINEEKKEAYRMMRDRDLAIVTLLLGTGVRISECVGLDIYDVKFDDDTIKLHRKGHKSDTIYMGKEVHNALLSYLKETRPQYKPDVAENALFLSRRGNRLSVRTIEDMVKKYAKASLPSKAENISPHKMRSTFATEVYKSTHDIKAVADALSHKSIVTTQKYYAGEDKEKKRQAFRSVKLRG